MDIIPVIDLCGGQVVHARRGERQHYQPLSSVLCRSAEPLDVVQGLLGLYPFKRLYIADLDAIQKQGNQRQTVEAIRTAYPQLELWLDSGVSRSSALQGWQYLDVTCVVGSENVASLADYLALRKALDGRFVLSLDHLDNYCGPEELLAQAALWPQQVIAMTLRRVGSDAGPDWRTLKILLQGAGDRQVFAAGGLRDHNDLLRLKQLGVRGALMASALHTGVLNQLEISRISG